MQEALFLALMAICGPGDTVVLESPIDFSLINLLQQLKLKIIEIPTSDDGISLKTLRFVLDNHTVKAMFSIPNFNNPMGFTMPSPAVESRDLERPGGKGHRPPGAALRRDAGRPNRRPGAPVRDRLAVLSSDGGMIEGIWNVPFIVRHELIRY